MELYTSGDLFNELYHACFDQEWVRNAPVAIIVAGRPKPLIKKYGDKGITFLYLEAGHVGQNIYLQAEALGLATVAVGLIDERGLARILGLPRGVIPIYVFPLGRRPSP